MCSQQLGLISTLLYAALDNIHQCMIDTGHQRVGSKCQEKVSPVNFVTVGLLNKTE